jgi:hypothetical protein
MSKKDFKINPKVFPKEYTFEEFKLLNPNINENVLINYYNKYLSEYLENKNYHVQDFNKHKNLLGEELKKQHWNFEAYDSMVDGGEGGRGRYYVENKYSNKSLYFPSGALAYVRVPNPGIGVTIKPREEITVSTWIKADDYSIGSNEYGTSDPGYYQKIISCAQSGGWFIRLENTRITFFIKTNPDKNDITSSGTGRTVSTLHKRFLEGYDLYKESGWHNLVGTWDGFDLKLYIDGEIPTINNTNASVSTREYIFYDTDPAQNDVDILIGTDPGGNSIPGHTEHFFGAIDNTAVWDKALDADTIKTLYNNGVPKHNLALDVVNLDSRDGHDFLKPYKENLQGWWRFEEGSGTLVKDHSPTPNDGTITNGAFYTGSTPY